MSTPAPEQKPGTNKLEEDAKDDAKATLVGAAKGALTGGLAGAARGAGMALLKSKSGKKLIGVTIAANIVVGSGLLGPLTGVLASPSDSKTAWNTQAQSAMSKAVTDPHTLDVLRSASEQTGVQESVLVALWQAEQGRGTGQYTGPFAIDTAKAKPAISAADAGDLRKSAVWVGRAFAAASVTTVDRTSDHDLNANAYMAAQPDGSMKMQAGPAQANVTAAYTAAIGTLPLAGMPQAAQGVTTSAVALSTGQVSSCSSSSQVATGGSTSVALDDTQKGYAQTIINRVAARGMPSAAAEVAIATALQESTLRMYWNPKVPGSRDLTHDAAAQGTDGYSVGLYQQQVHGSDYSWGTVQDAMDPDKSTDMFLDALARISGWQSMPVTVAAQTVQGSAYPEAYAKWAAEAAQLVSDLKPTGGTDAAATPAPSPSPSGSASPSASSSVAPAASTSSCGRYGTGTAASGVDDYPYSGKPGDSFVDPWSLYNGECVSFVAWRMNQQMGWKDGQDYPFTPAKLGLALLGNATDWKDNLARAGYATDNTPKPGAIAWWSANGAPGIGDSGHVAVVKQVNPDGTIFIEEYNFLPDADHAYHTRTIPASSVNGFIHVADTGK